MKNIFPGYIKKTEAEIRDLWKNGLLCFDANVLLNLYRYSNETREEILNLIEKFDNKIWLPHQSALEYNRNRYEVIAAQERTYKDFISKIKQIENDLNSTSKPPFLSNKMHSALTKSFSAVNKEVEDSIKKYCNLLQDDQIYERISKLFSGKISEPFSQKELDDIYLEGKTRYEEKKPPGYEDEKNKNGIQKYGDLVLWKQIIKKANEEKKAIILITDERKEDWWWKIKDGRNMGPRQELVEEIKKEAKVNFHMYSSERFLSFGFEFLKEQINDKVLMEIQEMTKNEINKLTRTKFSAERLIIDKELINNLDNQTQRINEIKSTIESVKHGLNIYQQEPLEKPETKERIIDLSIQLQMLKTELETMNSSRQNTLDSLEYRRKNLKKYDDYDK